MKKMSLKAKLVIFFLAVGIVPFAAIGITSLTKSSGALSQSAYNQLEGMREVKKGQIEQFFAEREGDMGVLMETVGALRNEAFAKLGAVQEIKENYIRDYITQLHTQLKILRDDPIAQKALVEFDRVFEDSGKRVGTPQWEALASKYDPRMRDIMEDNGWYDIFLIHIDGDIVYTVERESDLGMVIPDSSLKDSGLGRAYYAAQNMGKNDVVTADFSPYAPSGGQQAAFMMAKLSDAGNGEVLGYVAFQVPTDKINEIMQQRAGMGATGESYLVGHSNGKTSFRSDMETMGGGKFVIGYEISTPYIEQAVQGNSGRDVYTDSSGNLVIVAYDPLHLLGLQWACLSKINLEEAIVPRATGEEMDYFAKYIDKYGYYDLFLIHPEGNVFYTVTKEADFGSNMVSGKYADSGLGKLVRRVLETRRFGLADFAPYAPSNDEPAAFIAQPVVHSGEVELVVALQLSLDAINNIMQQRAGMGQTGETYLVGPDKLMRSDSFLDPENHSVNASFANPATGSVDTEAAREALSGKTDNRIIMDYNGNPVLSAYTPLKVGDTVWALIAEIDEAEAFASVKTLKWLMAVMAAVGIAAIVGIALLIARSITKPIDRITQGLNDGSDQVAAAAGQVSSSSQSLAEGASEQAASIEETSSSLEEMSSMTKQNADNASQADNLMKDANQVVAQANQSMDELTGSMQEISKASEETSKIIKTIDEIAFQTNLLALNAAVEAARAGEAGAGFAVVADEVRNLAMRAAEAAKNTAELIEGTVKKVSTGGDLVATTNEAFTKVAESASKVGELVAEIAVASNEQSQGIGQVNTAVTEMDKVVQQNAANAEESASASEELNAQAEQMRAAVGEMVQLIDGSSKKSGDRSGGGRIGSMLRKKVHAPAAPRAELEQDNHQVKLSTSKKVTPSDVIPMEGDEFEDF